MAPLIEKHNKNLIKRKAWCDSRHKPESFKNNQFALFFFAERKTTQAKNAGAQEKEAKADFRKLKRTYYEFHL